MRPLFVLLAAALSALIVWAALSGDFLREFAAVLALPWGAVALADLYLGFIVSGVVIAAYERRRTALALIVALFLLGNVVTALWLAWRGRDLVARLRTNR